MKIKNICLALCIQLVVVSCAMEDAVLNELTQQKGELDAAISLNVTNGLITRSDNGVGEYAGEETKDTDIATLSVFVLDGDRVVSATEVNGATIPQILVKVKNAVSAYTVWVVANNTCASSSGVSFINLPTRSAIEGAIQTLNYSSLVKTGSASVTLDHVYKGVKQALENPNPVTIQLKQMTARVELGGFTIQEYDADGNLYSGTGDKYFGSNSQVQDVVITHVQLRNVVGSSYTAVDRPVATDRNNHPYWKSQSTLSTPISVYDAIRGNVFPTEANKPYFFTFPSFGHSGNETNAVQIVIGVKVGDKEVKNYTYVINRETEKSNDSRHEHAYVRSGYLYRLFVTAKVVGDELIECAVKCYTLDWEKNAYEIDTEEV